ncbi:MAG: hypothetical protein ACREBC_37010 [Pyrinomonadaceae bacterium]
MPYAGYELKSKEAAPWANAIGSVLVNFGTLELLTYVWIERLSQSRVLFNTALDMQFARRCRLTIELIQERASDRKSKTEATRAWRKAETLAAFRNWIAHNPLVFGWKGQERDAPPDFVGVLNFKRMRRRNGKPRLIPYTSVSKIRDFNEEVVAVAKELSDLLTKFQSRQEGDT